MNIPYIFRAHTKSKVPYPYPIFFFFFNLKPPIIYWLGFQKKIKVLLGLFVFNSEAYHLSPYQSSVLNDKIRTTTAFDLSPRAKIRILTNLCPTQYLDSFAHKHDLYADHR